jgi:ribosomal protein L10
MTAAELETLDRLLNRFAVTIRSDYTKMAAKLMQRSVRIKLGKVRMREQLASESASSHLTPSEKFETTLYARAKSLQAKCEGRDSNPNALTGRGF